MKQIDENSFSRIELAIIEKHNCSDKEAKSILNSLKLFINCDESIYQNRVLQSALLTAVNTGRRAFLGGVYVYLPKNVKCLFNWSGNKEMEKIIKLLGGKVVDRKLKGPDVIYVGQNNSNIDYYRIVGNEWQGGVLVPGDNIKLSMNRNSKLCLGGIAASAIVVGLMFLKKSSIYSLALLESTGISLWRPDLIWCSKEAIGPKIKYLPQKYWLLGLGHLGQAYLWNMSFLPFSNSSKVMVYLQDIDRIIKANIDSGLLSFNNSIGKLKTRVCQKFLEDRKFETRLIEKRFDKSFKVNRKDNEPLLALCGFDNLESRLELQHSEFDYIVNCGLGGALDSFDDIMIDSLPNSETYKFWETRINAKQDILHKTVNEILNKEMEDKCGIFDIANKAISTSFVGALAGTLALGDLLRGLNDGQRFMKINVSIRNLSNIKTTDSISYKSQLTPNGFLGV
jgi:hypothetical protein